MFQMQDVVDEVLKAEAGAEEIIAKAREKAQGLRQEAEQEINRKVAEAREKARKIIQDKVSSAKEQAAAEYKEAISSAERRSQEFWERNTEKVTTVVEKLAAYIITPEFERE
jgi:vacuolar-type H+-ATPase subunit H